MDSTRLRRIVSRQEEVERKLREKEAQRLAQEHARRAARAEEVRKACEDLLRNQESFHKMDELLGGYRGADSCSHSLVQHSEHDIKVHNSQKMVYNKTAQGTLQGSEWTKTPLGWMRIESSFCKNMYKQPCTVDSLPYWLYEELDIIFGLRRISSFDFISTCSMLDKMFSQYIGKDDTNKSVKKRMIIDIQLAISRIKKNPECVRREQSLVATVQILENLEKSITKLYPQTTQTKNNETLTQQDLNLISSLPEDSEEISNICTILPEELILHIFSYLYNPKDLCTASVVCVSWSTLANDNTLYQHFILHLCKLLSISPPESTLPKKEIFIQLWTHKIGAPMSGLYQCDRCRELYWVFKKSFCPGYSGLGSKYHTGHQIDLSKFIRTLTNRIHHF